MYDNVAFMYDNVAFMYDNVAFMYDNVAPSFEILTRFMKTQIAYHYTSISTNIITYVTTW